MAWRAVIGGVDHTADLRQASGVSIELALNERARASFVCRNGYVPARFAEVVLYAQDGTTPLFGGVVLSRSVTGMRVGTKPMFTSCECGDYGAYADWCYTSQDYTTAPTLKAVLQDLIADNLTAYGITLHASQVIGPTLSVFSWDRKRVSDALRELSDRTGYVWRIDASKVLRMFVPGTDAAPVTIVDAGPNCRELTWRDTDDQPANTVTVLCGPSGTGTPTQTWTASGSATNWTVDIAPVVGGWTQGYVLEGATVRTVSAAGGGGYYYWNDSTGVVSVGTGSTPGAGVVLTWVYTAQYPFAVQATSGASPVIEYQAAAPDVLTRAAGQEVADGLLAQLDQQPRDVAIHSLTAGWLPGQLLTVDLTDRSFDALAIITTVRIGIVTDGWWEYDIQATENTTYTGSYLDQWRAMAGGGSSVATVSVSGGGGSSTVSAGSPFPLGGARSQPLELAVADWFAVPEWIRFEAPATGTVQIKADLWAMEAGVSAQARLYCLSDSGAAGSPSSAVTSTTATSVSWSVAVEAGKDYCLQVKAGTNAKAVFCVGTGRYL